MKRLFIPTTAAVLCYFTYAAVATEKKVETRPSSPARLEADRCYQVQDPDPFRQGRPIIKVDAIQEGYVLHRMTLPDKSWSKNYSVSEKLLLAYEEVTCP